MKKIMLAVFTFTAFVTAPPLTFASDGMAGSFAIGYDTGAASVSARYFFNDFGLEFLAGFTMEPLDPSLGDTQTLLDLRGTLYGIYAFQALDRANLNIFAGIEAEYAGSHIKGQGSINYYGRVGLSPEIFLMDNLSVEASFGLEISYASAPVPNTSRLKIQLYGNEVSIVSGLAFHWYIVKPEKGHVLFP